MIWARLHWAAGTLRLIAFLAEGAYMRYVVEVFHLEDAPRLVYRSRFLLMLLIGVVNLALAGLLVLQSLNRRIEPLVEAHVEARGREAYRLRLGNHELKKADRDQATLTRLGQSGENPGRDGKRSGIRACDA